MLSHLHYLHGKPVNQGQFKLNNEDFVVKEDLGYDLDGEGEHVLVNIRKNGSNTIFIAEQLAKFANISPKLVSYAGLKDRNAVTEQWFGLHMPGKETPDFSSFEVDNCTVLSVTRHLKKLKIGALKGNFFSLILRAIEQQDDLEQRLVQIKNEGVPNYFGEQRFGKDNQNIEQAILWAQGEIKIKDRKKRGFYLSAARSAIFNSITSQRIAGGLERTVINGDILQLADRGSWFVAAAQEVALLQQRLDHNELNITAPLVGDNGLGTKEEALLFEQQCMDSQWSDFLALFRNERMETARRAILLRPKQFNWQWINKEALQLEFWLPAGSYATSVLRELIR